MVTTGYDTYWVAPYFRTWFRIYGALFGLASAFRIPYSYSVFVHCALLAHIMGQVAYSVLRIRIPYLRL